jgi:tetratricopeptide (TPR) repeat protein
VDRSQQTIFDDPLAKARELKARGDHAAAQKVLETALAQRPDDLKLKASLADLYYRTNHPRQALKLAGEILRDDPDDPRALVVMGNTLLKRGKPGEGLEYFRLAIQVAPTDYLWGRAARCHLELKQAQAALEALNEAERLAPPSPRLLGLRAACYRLLGEREAERQTLLRAARAAPADPEGFFKGVWPVLSDLAPRRAAEVSEMLRATPDQADNPHLLLLEAESLLASRDPQAAAERLDRLAAGDPPERIAQAAAELTAKLAGSSDGGKPS